MASNSKRKQVTLTLLEKLNAGVVNSAILTTLFYIKKKKEEILKAAPVFANKRHVKRGTFLKPKQGEFD